MKILTTVDDVRNWRKAQTGTVGFVPTMGALHAGHLSLMQHAKQRADVTLASIFVNPTQFAPHEDLEKYPRPLDQDLNLCRSQNIQAVWTPRVQDIYPENELNLTIDIPALTTILEGANRPTHFQGVCRVVAKLFGIVQPTVACFGQKDYQQLKVIQALTQGLSLPITISSCPTIYESDGLAMSSRNVYLTPQQRTQALSLSHALDKAQQLIAAGQTQPRFVEQAMIEILNAQHAQVDYATLRHTDTLAELEDINPNRESVVCLIAAKFGNTRLIDNRIIQSKND